MKHFFAVVILICCLEISAVAQLKAGGVDTDLLLQKASGIGWIDTAEKYINHQLMADYAKCYYPVFDSIEALKNQKCCNYPPYRETENEVFRKNLIRQFQTMSACNDNYLTTMTHLNDSLRKVVIEWCMVEIKPIAQANGYDLVFDLCKEPTLPLPPCDDITNLLLKKLEW